MDDKPERRLSQGRERLDDHLDTILVECLELQSRIGITGEERAEPQRLTVSLELVPGVSFSEMQDDLERTVNYAAVCTTVQAVAARGERDLIETLAEDVAETVLQEFSVVEVGVELRKFILPETAWVGVKLRRRREQ